eukprot:TRINITY_DN8182_c0_g2_i2.p1 TRINITY_DN8182_c0_g2~~TRINITY_DN8182_c0_g2_i2.p1  ORF type:complete len:507 (+),score=54.64 TRINITY_DN8182_c0_g2_i2:154-1521(+)
MTSKQNNCKNNGHLQLDEQGCKALSGTVQSCVEQDNRNNYLGEQQINFSIMGDQNQQTEVASNQEIHYAQEQLQDDRNRESLFESNNTEITLQSAASLPAVINSNAQEFLQQNSIILQPIYSEIKEDENIEEQIQQGKTIVNSDYFNYIISKSNAKNQFATPPPCTNLIDNSNTNSFSSSSGQQQHKPVNQENIYDVNGAGLGQEEVVITVADENNISNENNHKNNNNLASKNKHNFDSQGGIQNSFSLASEKQEGISGCISDKLSKEQKDDQASNLYSQESIPQHFICPITKDIMVQPVVLVSTGQIYERQAIQEWFQNGHRTCPVTGQTVASLMLQDLHPLRSAIYEFAGSAGIEMEHCEQVANSEEFSETTMHAQITAADLLNAYLTIRIREREQSQAGELIHFNSQQYLPYRFQGYLKSQILRKQYDSCGPCWCVSSVGFFQRTRNSPIQS